LRELINVTGEAIALDTTAAIGFLAGETGWVALVRAAGRAFLPVVVVGELRFGALNSTRRDANIAAIEALITHCVVLPADDHTAAEYAQVRLGLKTRGRPIPENDVWIAALCCQHRVPLATRDAHFQHVEGLRVIQPAA
jgi:tRNA(fMet)-specific endonuclease VapC